jgi:hypothetical protein
MEKATVEVESTKMIVKNSSETAVTPEDGPSACHMRGKGWFKGGLAMALCCAAPLLIVAAVTLFGMSLGALASGFLTIAALFACPVGMYLMMRMMMNNKK